MKNVDMYQEQALTTAKLNLDSETWYFALGLAGEVGETIDHIKKMYRDDDGELTPERKQKILLELGDVSWYLSVLAKACGFDMSQVLAANVEKLQGRVAAGTLHGDGDNR